MRTLRQAIRNRRFRLLLNGGSYEKNGTFYDYGGAIADAAVMSFGALNDGDADANGIGANNTTTGTWVTLTDGVGATLQVNGALYVELDVDRIPIGKASDGTETDPVDIAGNPVNFMNVAGNTGNFGVSAADELQMQYVLIAQNADNKYRHTAMRIYGQNAGSRIPIIASWSSTGKIQTIVDDLVVAETQVSLPYDWGANDYSDYEVRDPAAASPDDDILRNFALIGATQNLGGQRLRVGFAGDSLLNFGGFPDWMWKDRPDQTPEWVPLTHPTYFPDGPNGLDGANGAAAEASVGRDMDRGALSTIIRQLSKLGYQTANNYNFADGGAPMSRIRTNVANMMSVSVPNVLFLNGGQNDANDGASFDSAAADAYEADIKAIIDTAKGAGVGQIIMSNLHSMQNNSTFSAQVYADNVDTANARITAAKAYSDASNGSDFFLVADAFTAFGGHTPTVSLFRTNDVHHSTAGGELFGRLVGQLVTY